MMGEVSLETSPEKHYDSSLDMIHSEKQYKNIVVDKIDIFSENFPRLDGKFQTIKNL